MLKQVFFSKQRLGSYNDRICFFYFDGAVCDYKQFIIIAFDKNVPNLRGRERERERDKKREQKRDGKREGKSKCKHMTFDNNDLNLRERKRERESTIYRNS